MKAVRVTAQASGGLEIAPLPLPVISRQGVASAEAYHRRAAGQAADMNFNANAADAIRAIAVSDGPFKQLASHPGALVTFVLAGELILGAASETLVAGDILFTDERTAAAIAVSARNRCRLLQIGVPADWPGASAEIQGPGTINPREGDAPKFKRIYTGADDKAYFEDFNELIPATLDTWSEPHALTGFRMLTWEDGSMDYHPSVTNQLCIISAGEMETELRRGGAIEIFRAGDICLATDRTGEGHKNSVRGHFFGTVMILETAHLW